MNQRFYSNVQVAGDNILVREVNGQKRTNRKIPYKPTLFVQANEPTKYKTLEGEFVEAIQPGTIRETKEWLKQYEEVKNFSIYGNTQFQYNWIAENYPQDVVEYDFKLLAVFSLDIEAEAEKGFPNVVEASERINLITFKNIQTQEIYSFGLPFFGTKKQKFTTDNKKVHYYAFDTEEEMLSAFLDKWAEVQPDVIMGWNVEMFDIPYLINRMYKLLGQDVVRRALSPWANIRAVTVKFMQQEKPAFQISGVSILDYMRLYRKYVFEPRENYKLGYVAEVDLGITKLDHTEYDTFSEFYRKDWQKYVDYNIRDVELVEALDKKWKLIELLMMVAYRAKINYEDVMSQTRVWDMLIYNVLRKRDIVIPMKATRSKDRQYDGAYVKEPIPGLYHWVVSFDVQSLYPSIMMILNIGFETKLLVGPNQTRLPLNPKNVLEGELQKKKPGYMSHMEYVKGLGVTVATNGICYSKDQKSILSELLFQLFQLRLEYKGKLKEAKKAGDKDLEAKWDISQQAVKIILNSCYGAVGCEYFRYFDVDNAEAVTHTGQFIIQYVERGINEYLNKLLKTNNVKYVVYCDTDSAYITLEPLVKSVLGDTPDTKKAVDFLVKACDGPLNDHINKLFGEISDRYLNGIDPKILKMNREAVADKAIWTSKKRYILNVHDSEGFRYPEPKLKMKGIEIVKASNPKFCRDKMREAVNLIMKTGSNEVLIDFIDKTREEFCQLPPEEISSPRGVNGLGQYGNTKTIYSDKTPLHTKGALLYNHYLKAKGLIKKYQPIQEGEKIKYIYLKLPNPIREKVIAFNGELPKELGLHKYIDFNLQFEKTFLEPLGIILTAIKWKSEKVATLEKWF